MAKTDEIKLERKVYNRLVLPKSNELTTNIVSMNHEEFKAFMEHPDELLEASGLDLTMSEKKKILEAVEQIHSLVEEVYIKRDIDRPDLLQDNGCC